ncbi:MAG: isoprenylcysteine carboxylmethyltransferase family protein [Rhodospirillales bacterium]|nr:isoprenylcysteine carboxylmethyltransferase family protein [Rhodospirillales bacterium]
MLAAHIVYFLAWLSFALGHSILAATGVKARLVPLFGAGYRLAYNLFAAAHIALVWGIGRTMLAGAPAFARPDWLKFLMPAMAAVGAAALLGGLAGYDLGRFGGLAQLRAARAGAPLDEDGPLHIGGLNRWVRHPLYAGGFLVLWGLASDPLGLATALWGSLYLVIGARFEERKLLRLYGQAYADYRARVPAFVPWRGRAV